MGLAPTEATNLTAFLVGIPLTGRSWTLDEIDRLLFLRELDRSGRFSAVAQSSAA